MNQRKRVASARRMKNFFTSMLGALVALMIFSVGCALLFIGFLAAMAALGVDWVPSGLVSVIPHACTIGMPNSSR